MKAYCCVTLISAALVLGACVTNPSGEGKGAKKDIEVSQTERGTLITVSERVLFDSGSSELKKDSRDLLDNVAKVLNEKTRNPILIEGHTDNVGSKDANIALSEKRAFAVKRELVSRGVSDKRITTKGLWFSAPKGDNTTAEGRSINRRTEITVLGEKKENLGNNLEEMLGNVWLKVKQIFS